jgi:SAM-dependent methyltransferase
MNAHCLRFDIRIALLAAYLLVVALPASAVAESTFDEEMRLFSELLSLRPGAAVADIGAGEGDYALAVAEIVGETGAVYATELDEDKLEALRVLEQERGLPQFHVVEGHFEDTALDTASVDAAFLRDVYHHITQPEKFMTDLYRTIRPGGRLVLIDFPPTFWLALFTPKGIPENRGGHGIPIDLLIDEAKAAGFVPIRTVERWPSSNFVTRTYGVAFERPATPTR